MPTHKEKKIMPKSLVEIGTIIGELKAYRRDYYGKNLSCLIPEEQMKQWALRLGDIINQEL